MGRFYFSIPNTESRKKALIFHDIHHIVTGYSAEWKGEVAISAWEISSGCGKYYAAWFLDLAGMAIGLFIYPIVVFKAFKRGRRTRNLYDNAISKEQALEMTVSDLSGKLLLTDKTEDRIKFKELLAFIYWSFISLLFILTPLAFWVLILFWLV